MYSSQYKVLGDSIYIVKIALKKWCQDYFETYGLDRTRGETGGPSLDASDPGCRISETGSEDKPQM